MIISGENWRVHVGDVRKQIALLPESSVHCCVTSPPYFGLRDYGFDGQIGSEKTPDEFVATMVDVFRGVKRVLRDDGVLFVNLGDSYSAHGSGSAGKEAKWQGESIASRKAMRLEGVAPGNMIGIPWRVAFALQADGWVLRQCIVWAKRSPMPESVSGWRWMRCRVKVGASSRATDKKASTTPGRPQGDRDGADFASSAEYTDCPGCRKCSANGGMVLRRGSWRPTTSHEFIFMFTKGGEYFCDGDGSKEPTSGGAHHRGNGVNPKSLSGGMSRQNESFSRAVNGLVEPRNMRSVWMLSSEPFKGAHFATFPTELVRRCLSAATSRGGCCSACGSQYAPIVESKRTATRPGTDSKVNRVTPDDCMSTIENGPPDAAAELVADIKDGRAVVGNRDPQRHTTTTVVNGYRPTCSCDAPVARPVVLDCFSGSGTTGQVAVNMGCQYVGIEGNADYAEMSRVRIETPWQPKHERKGGQKPAKAQKRRSDVAQLSLFGE